MNGWVLTNVLLTLSYGAAAAMHPTWETALGTLVCAFLVAWSWEVEES